MYSPPTPLPRLWGSPDRLPTASLSFYLTRRLFCSSSRFIHCLAPSCLTSPLCMDQPPHRDPDGLAPTMPAAVSSPPAKRRRTTSIQSDCCRTCRLRKVRPVLMPLCLLHRSLQFSSSRPNLVLACVSYGSSTDMSISFCPTGQMHRESREWAM